MPATVRQIDRPAGQFFGREHDIAHLDEARCRGIRSLQLSGGPGVGKTRLAVELATSGTAASVMVPSRDVSSPDGLFAAILGVLRRRHEPEQSVVDEVVRALGATPTVLVLDDLSAFDGIEAVLCRLLDDCPTAELIITTRRPILKIDGVVHRLDPLPIPPLDDLHPDTAIAHPAIALFCDRAVGVNPTFALDAGNVSTVASICGRANGIPLAIELVAGRLAVMSPQALLAEVDRSSVLDLVGGALRDSIERTWSLLTSRQRALIENLSILVAAASLETIHAISDGDQPISTTIDDLTQLVDVHLLDPDHDSVDGSRFSLPPAIAAFGREQLERAGREPDARRRLVQAMADRARAHASGTTSLQRPPTRSLLVEFDNVRLAIDSAVGDADADAGIVVQFLVDAAPDFVARGESRRLAAHVSTLLDRRADQITPALRASGLAWLGRCESDHSHPPDREALTRRLREVLEVVDQIHDDTARLDVLVTVTEMLPYLTDPSVATTAATHGLQLATTIGAEATRARFLSLSGVIAHKSGAPAQAARLAVDAIGAALRAGDESVVARASLVLHGIDREHWPNDAPEISLPHVVDLARRSDDERLLLWTLAVLGADQVALGDEQRAAHSIVELLRLAEPLDYTPSRRHALTLAAMLAARREDHVEAARFLGSLSLVTAVVAGGMAPNALERHTAMIARTRTALGDDRFRELCATGGARSWSEAVDAAYRYAEMLAEGVPAIAASVPPAVSTGNLTTRELDVLRLLATGATNKSIAATLGLRPKTVMHHNESIYRKLRVRGRAAAVSVAMRTGLLDQRP
jgi:predicted ATPase/DNA-binding CsgD family transcriptional regulator